MFGETYVKLLSICAPLRTRFPTGMSTVKDLCRVVFSANYEQICSSSEHPVDKRCIVVWQQLKEILVDVPGVDPDEVTFRSRLIRNLGIA